MIRYKGSCHDNGLIKDSKTMQMADEPFKTESEGETREFCWCDSAYVLKDYTCALFKKVNLDSFDNQIFNYHISAIRIKSKHCIGA